LPGVCVTLRATSYLAPSGKGRHRASAGGKEVYPTRCSRRPFMEAVHTQHDRSVSNQLNCHSTCGVYYWASRLCPAHFHGIRATILTFAPLLKRDWLDRVGLIRGLDGGVELVLSRVQGPTATVCRPRRARDTEGRIAASKRKHIRPVGASIRTCPGLSLSSQSSTSSEGRAARFHHGSQPASADISPHYSADGGDFFPWLR
jgi:hypothetical protein